MSNIIKEDPSWVTKYNGFNNGKDASDGVGGRRIPLQIKTMSKTKEEILNDIKTAVAEQFKYRSFTIMTEQIQPSEIGAYVNAVAEQYAAQVLKENLIAFKRWYDKLTPSDKCTVWAPPGSGYGRGLYDMSDEDLIEKFLKKKS